jgi:tetratricopeptide (TPR) repeat protein
LSLAKAKLFLKIGNLREAEIEVRKYLVNEPSSSHYEAVISLFEEMGYRDEAEKWREEMFRKSIAQGSDNASDYVGLAEILIKRGENNRAIECLEMLILSSPENPEGLRISAVFAENHGLFNEALRWRKMLLPLAFDDDFNKFQIAWLTAKTGKLDEGVDLLIKLLNSPRTTNFVRLKAGVIFPNLVAQRKDLLAKLEQDARERMRVSPRQEDFILLANLKSGDVKNQKQVLEGALSSLSHPYYCAWMLADIYESEGNLSAVSEYLHKVMYYLPHRDDVFIRLSGVELRRGKTRRALDALPWGSYQYTVEPTPYEGEMAKVRFALRSVEDEPNKRAEFFIRLSESAEQLDWLDMAIAFASEALNILEEEKQTSTIKAQPPGERGWRKWFVKEGAPPKGGKLSEIPQRIEHLKNKRAQKLKAKSLLLRITSNLENVP